MLTFFWGGYITTINLGHHQACNNLYPVKLLMVFLAMLV